MKMLNEVSQRCRVLLLSAKRFRQCRNGRAGDQEAVSNVSGSWRYFRARTFSSRPPPSSGQQHAETTEIVGAAAPAGSAAPKYLRRKEVSEISKWISSSSKRPQIRMRIECRMLLITKSKCSRVILLFVYEIVLTLKFKPGKLSFWFLLVSRMEKRAEPSDFGQHPTRSYPRAS